MRPSQVADSNATTVEIEEQINYPKWREEKRSRLIIISFGLNHYPLGW
jgi:hypothetical protein